ncbi:hypothetical protein JOF29_005408 [Kribbella aluminosa]|uniref:Uncharacterized protein n=1 Tax=Kribbella aluminosa TaxID=416017 RepID=A0ABS4URM8_9ACTN|nr:hypothetical protein [Kribbella aluminosa]MBP2354298.1 hypothetical protein [Kribbella aluminosa]
MLRTAIGLGALALSLGTAVPPAVATPDAQTAATAACALGLGSLDINTRGVNSRVLTSAGAGAVVSTPNVYNTPYAVQQPTAFTAVPAGNGRTTRSGKVVWGSGYLMQSTYTVGRDGKLVGTPVFQRIGNGWGGRFLIQSQYKASAGSKPSRTMLYQQDEYGLFGRWTEVGKGLRNTGYVSGMSSMKSFTLIAATPTYDMFLANNRAGGLYTVKIPTSVPLKPIITPVRTSSWQTFEQLVSAPCGRDGTLLLGIDKDTNTGHLYTVGHAAGTKTVIKSLGKVPTTFPDWNYFRFTPAYNPLNGG